LAEGLQRAEGLFSSDYLLVSRRPHLYVSVLLIHVETVLKVCLLSVKPGSPLSTGQHSTPSKASLSGWAPLFSFEDEMMIDGPCVPREEMPGRAEIGVVGLIPLEHPFSPLPLAICKHPS